MKRLQWLFGFCLMVLVLWGGSVSVFAWETDDFTYIENSDGTICITRYKGSDETVTVPSEINGKAVKSVGGFKDNKTIKHVIISEGIVELKCFWFLHDGNPTESTTNGAFTSCENLESVTLPSTLKIIGNRTFQYCTSLKNAVLPDGLLHIDEKAFERCKSLESITLPDGLLSIGSNAFMFCDSLEKVVIPDSVNDIGYAAFYIKTTIFANLDSNLSIAVRYLIVDNVPVPYVH